MTMTIDDILRRLGVRPKKRGLEAQLDSLRRDIRQLRHSATNHAGHLAGSVSHRASHVGDEWGDSLADLSREAARYGTQIAETAGEHSRRAVRAVKNDPLPVIAVIGTVVLLSALLRSK
jgi:hypothetical protein